MVADSCYTTATLVLQHFTLLQIPISSEENKTVAL